VTTALTASKEAESFRGEGEEEEGRSFLSSSLISNFD
jgi:hypothetical protein